jgi:acyl carrier protein
MLSGSKDAASGEPSLVEARVLGLIAETCGLLGSELSPDTPLSEALDSLTLMTVVTRMEAVFDIVLAGDETIELFQAVDVAELGRLIARKVERSRANHLEDARNESC